METRILISICVMMLLCSAATAETYYVSLQGDDANDGKTAETTFRTVKKGVSVLQAGDTLIIKSGNYGNERAVVSASGTPQSPITIKAEETGKVILKGTGGGNGIFMQNKNHILVEGIEFGNYGAGIGIKYASSYVTVRKCVFRENNSFGILVYGNFRKPESSQGIVLTENTFLDFTDKQDYGLCLYASCNLKATNNYFYGVHHQALSFKKLMKDSVASGNVFEGFRYSAIYLGQNDDSTDEGYLRSERLLAEGNVFRPTKGYHAKSSIVVANVTDAIVRNNFVDSVYGGEPFSDKNQFPGSGIHIAPVSTGAKIYGNLIINAMKQKPAFLVRADCEIYNNTIVGSGYGMVIVPGANPIVRNNIFYRNEKQVDFDVARIETWNTTEHMSRREPGKPVWTWKPDMSKKPVFEHNNWFPRWDGMGETDISVDPKFVGPFKPLKVGGLNPVFTPDFKRAEAYKLSDDSPCKGMGAFETKASK
ncbi:MAG: right-handed parallel beta-helix repeat-containing protein [Planctomycetota bacterium]|nr:right-handed parallel beta-helix repeat-containing protein [Planctomycetota bacterium]